MTLWPRRVGWNLVLAWLVCSAGCADDSLRGDRHPRLEFVHLTAGMQVHSLRISDAPHMESGGGVPGTALAKTLGSLDGESDLSFGRIEDVGVVDDSTLAVVDSRRNELFLINLEGSTVAALGGPGEGPGEFRYPNSVAVLSERSVLVTDSRGRSISTVSRSDSGWAITSKRNVDLVPLDICASDAGVYIHGFRMDGSGHVLHFYDDDLEHQRSFGRVYQGPDPSINRNLSRGHLDCSQDAIFYASEGLGEVRRYSMSGELIWVRRFDAFRPIPYIRRESEGTTLNPIPEGGGQIILFLTTFGGENLVVQSATVTREGRAEGRRYDRVDTSVLSDEEGRLRYRTGPSRWIVQSANENLLLGVEQNPFPQVAVFM